MSLPAHVDHQVDRIIEDLNEELEMLLNEQNIWDKQSELISIQRRWNPETPAQNLFWPTSQLEEVE